ncbi:MAG: hypothetical protein JXM70_08715 [Pirellulales bacterium]|nr:hypothetical protein [Pirellulales bacterium]
MSSDNLENSPPETLADLMNLETDTPPWNADELAAVWKHQLAAPIDFDLTYLEANRPASLDTLHSLQGPAIASFDDLFHHPQPPIELLRSTKEFAKLSRSRQQAPLPEEIATMLYLLSITASVIRLRRRITKLDDQALRHSLDWALEQSWIDDDTRGLLIEGRRAVEGKETD